MAYGTGCHKCGGYPGAGGPRERAALYQCLNCGSYTCNQHLIGLIVRSCPACNGQKLKQVSSASKVSRQSRQQSQLSNDKGGGRSRKQRDEKGSGSSPNVIRQMDESVNLGAMTAPQGKTAEVKSYTAATITQQAGKGFVTQSSDVSEIMRHLTGEAKKPPKGQQGFMAVQIDPKDKATDLSGLDLDDIDALDLDNITAVAVVTEEKQAEKPQEDTSAKQTNDNKPLGFWAEPDANKRKARIHLLAQHDGLFELDSPQFYNDAIKRIAATHKARDTACHLLALRLDNQPEADISAHLSTFEEQVEPLFTSLQIRLLDDAPSMDMQTYRNLHDQHPSLSAVGPVYLSTLGDVDERKQNTMLKDAAKLALELKCPLYVSLKGQGEINLPEILHDELEHGLTGVLCSPYVDALSLLMVQDHSWFITIRPEHSYDENADSRDFISCLPFEKLMLSTGNEVNAPKLHRGHFNSPSYLRDTFNMVQKLLDKKPDLIRQQTNAAWRYLFLGEAAPKDIT